MTVPGMRGLPPALGRRWWIVVAAFALVASIALVRYAGPGSAARHRYLSTQALAVSVLPPASGGAYAGLLAQHTADSLASQLTRPAFLTAGPFDRAVAAQIAADRSGVAARFGAQAATPLAQMSTGAIAGALSAVHAGGQVSLTARWPTPAGAWALASAAGQVLNAHLELIPSAGSGLANGASVRIVPSGSATAPTLDPGPEQAAIVRLTETLALGLLLGAGMALLVAVWESRYGQTPATPPAADAAMEGRGGSEVRSRAPAGSE